MSYYTEEISDRNCLSRCVYWFLAVTKLKNSSCINLIISWCVVNYSTMKLVYLCKQRLVLF